MNIRRFLFALTLPVSAGCAMAQSAAASCAQEAEVLKLEDGSITCVFGLKAPTPEETEKRAALVAEELARRRHQSTELLKKDVIRIEATYRMDPSVGNPVAANTWWTTVWEARPSSGAFRYYISQSGTVCNTGQPKATFTVNQDGMLHVAVIPHLPECGRVAYVFDPISRTGTIMLVDKATGSERRSRSGTRIRLLED